MVAFIQTRNLEIYKKNFKNFVNLWKTDFLFAGFSLNRIIQKKKRQKKAHFMDDALKQGALYI